MRSMVLGLVTMVALLGAGACSTSGGEDGGGASASGGTGASGGLVGAPCTAALDCLSGACVDGECGPSELAAEGSDCVVDGQCATGSCVDGVCAASPCTADSDCSSGNCFAGHCAVGVTGGGAQWVGGGTGYRGLTAGCGPDTAASCTGDCEAGIGTRPAAVIRPVATLCFSGEGDLTPDDPAAVIEQVVETVDGVSYVHIRVIFDPSYVDNTYGANASAGWFPEGEGGAAPVELGPDGKPKPPRPGKSGHTFKDLTGSDHTELQLTDGAGAVAMQMKLDLITASESASCAYETLGVLGGEGEVSVGDPAAVLAVATSITRNLNGCGYCTAAACGGDCTVDSPATDEIYTPNPDTPKWDYRQAYEAWIDLAAFGDAGFGQAFITYTHASPSMAGNTLIVEPSPCPPDWCVDGDTACYGTPPGETPPGDGACPPNYQLYVAEEGADTCTPIPYANYPGMAACPEGFVLDTASEGQFCLPVE